MWYFSTVAAMAVFLGFSSAGAMDLTRQARYINLVNMRSLNTLNGVQVLEHLGMNVPQGFHTEFNQRWAQVCADCTQVYNRCAELSQECWKKYEECEEEENPSSNPDTWLDAARMYCNQYGQYRDQRYAEFISSCRRILREQERIDLEESTRNIVPNSDNQ
ncbi:MAG: hypothetical protein IJA14_00535 [Alphaproteobacteria bacterium]|nr:hypothetical protein [Alphaproteobacteria bacterium]